jgi:hypothetical protein
MPRTRLLVGVLVPLAREIADGLAGARVEDPGVVFDRQNPDTARDFRATVEPIGVEPR